MCRSDSSRNLLDFDVKDKQRQQFMLHMARSVETATNISSNLKALLCFRRLLGKSKDKFHNITRNIAAEEGKEVEIYLYYFLYYLRLMGWVASYSPWPLYPRVTDLITFVQEAGSASGPVWTSEKNLAPTGIRSRNT